MNTSHIAVIIGLCSLVFAGFILSNKLVIRNDTPRARDMLTESTLRIYATEYGSASTTEYVRTTATRYSAANQHLAAHALGQVLFEREGAERAFEMCGSLFGYGCLHQIISQVSPEEELDTAAEVLALCKEMAPRSPGNCLHAAGHSLVYTAGYDEERFRKVLNECQQTIPLLLPFDEEQSCYGGAFMEYNMRFMQDGAFTNGHVQASTVPFCLSLSDELQRRTCMFWMIPKAHAATNFSYSNRTLTTLGRFCDAVPATYQNECFSSIGRSIGLYGYLRNGTMIRYCELAAAHAPQHLSSCIHWAARTKAVSNARADIAPVCETLPSAQVRSCLTFSESFPD